jgi:2,4-dienoyl-CoA reductase-like NADH-dependent reductase (Old Yellow Enzyme family)
MAARFDRCAAGLVLAGGIRLANRIYFAPMGIDAADDDGSISEGMRRFYRDVIDGGCGLVILGNSAIDGSTRLQRGGLCLFTAAQADAVAPLLDYGEARRCPVAIQLQHYGAQGSTTMTDAPLLSPSGVPCRRMQRLDPNYRLRVMDQDDIDRTVRQFGRAAALARSAGSRLIQLQASNGYLIGSFLSPYTNKRTDKYGGDAVGRSRFLMEILDEIDRTTRGEISISVRLGIDDRVGAEGLQPALLLDTVRRLEAQNVAFISCSICIGETFGELAAPTEATLRDLHAGVRLVKSATTIPIGFAGGVGSLDTAEALLSREVCDLVGMTRAIFADNAIVSKSFAGRTQEIDWCRFDGNCFKDKSNPKASRVYCCVNEKYRRPTDIYYAS